MKTRKAAQLLSSIEYHDWRFTLFAEPCLENGYRQGAWVEMNRPSKDAITNIPMPQLRFVAPIDIESLDEESLMDTIFARVMQAETHEVAEFFKVNGVRIMNPHTTEGDGRYRDALEFALKAERPAVLGGFPRGNN